jgi:N,N'-diacetyllegionaminate synthase
MKQLRINNRVVKDGAPAFIVAEAGVNHNGSVERAKQLIEAAKEAGADSIKFQAFKADQIVTKYAERPEYQRETDKSAFQYDLLKKLELAPGEFKELFLHAKANKISFLCSVFDKDSVDFLDELGIPAFKIASGEITNFPLLKYIAQKRKPIILSTGMSTFDEIREALDVIINNGAHEIVLLYCVTSYPAKIESVNLRIIRVLKSRFGFPIGFSDHTSSTIIPVAAVALGAVLIEKHLTLDKKLSGPDHRASMSPNEFKEMVNSVRVVEKVLGDSIQRLPEEETIKKLVRRSIVARIPIQKGTVILEEMLDLKRPGVGISSKFMDKVVGKTAKANIEYDELITFDKLS